MQSIEDLINASGSFQGQNNDDDDETRTKLKEKEATIKLKKLEEITERRANSLGLSYINLIGFPISPEALKLLKESESHDLESVCFFYNGEKIRLAAVNVNEEIIKKSEELKKKYFCQVSIYLISPHSLKYSQKMYRMLPKVKESSGGISVSEEDLEKYSAEFSSFRDLQKAIDKSGITEIVSVITAASIKSGASDIHIEGEEKSIKVRFRIDGMLHDVAILNKDLWKKIISRLKILAHVKINVNNRPQDGRISIFTKKERIDIRASFLPTNYGESVVMRLLKSSSVGLNFQELGIRGKAFERLRKEIERPNGMIVTTGPTGSGKTTTLYAILKKLNKQETKIITVEDPIEYELEGVNQSQVGEKYTFAKALRSVVRQDPDVVMIGEIRDLETAEIAIQAALTGHLVLSTIHTNDAAGAIPRFLSMETKSFLLAPAINAVIGQRLVRKICEHCKKEDILDEEQKEKIKKIIENLNSEYKKDVDINNARFYKGEGCELCQGIGYKGRMGIYEVMIMNKEIEDLILANNTSEYDMRTVAVKNGMITMAQDGILKAIDGITSIEEIFRVADN